MNIASPTCVTKIQSVIDCAMNHSPSPSADESDAESIHHQLVERWFRERFFLPRPYRSTTIYDGDDKSQNDIIDESSSGRSFALFSDDLISKEIRSNIVPVSDDEGSCSLRHRCGSPMVLSSSEHTRTEEKEKRRPPLGVVMVVDKGAPMMPIERNEDSDVRLEAEPEDDGDDDDGLYGCKPAMGFIQRTFSFDEHLPMIHRRRAASIRSLTKCMEDDDDCYIDEQPSFTIPVSYSSDGSSKEKVLYPISISGSL